MVRGKSKVNNLGFLAGFIYNKRVWSSMLNYIVRLNVLKSQRILKDSFSYYHYYYYYYIAIAGNGWFIIACSEIPFDGDSYRIGISRFICIPNRLTGFCIKRVSAEGNYQIDFN